MNLPRCFPWAATTVLITGLGAMGFSQSAIAQPASITIPNPTGLRTFTSVNPTVKVDNDAAKAIAALQDNSLATNVELWYETETPSTNVGFTITNGSYNAFVSSVTPLDWSALYKGKTLAEIWLDDFLEAYGLTISADVRAALVNYFKGNGFPRAGDPNIAGATLTPTGLLSLEMLGFSDLKELLKSPSYSSGDAKLDALLKGLAASFTGPIAISEVAKVTSGTEISYAYSFKASPTGFTTTDGTDSFSGVYRWEQQLKATTRPPTATTPDPTAGPTALIGLGLLGAWALKRRHA